VNATVILKHRHATHCIIIIITIIIILFVQ